MPPPPPAPMSYGVRTSFVQSTVSPKPLAPTSSPRSSGVYVPQAVNPIPRPSAAAAPPPPPAAAPAVPAPSPKRAPPPTSTYVPAAISTTAPMNTASTAAASAAAGMKQLHIHEMRGTAGTHSFSDEEKVCILCPPPATGCSFVLTPSPLGRLLSASTSATVSDMTKNWLVCSRSTPSQWLCSRL